MKKTLHFYPHAGSGNHGCEAIVRTTAALFGKENRLKVYTFKKAEDTFYGVSGEALEFIPSGFRRYSMMHFKAAICRRVLKDERFYIKAAFPALFNRNFGENDVCISIGGDNYCYNNMVERLNYLDQLLCRAGARHMVLWGCSIEPELFEKPELLNDLARFRWLVARESLTYAAMCKAGFGEKTILAPDPAFLLPPAELPLPPVFQAGNTVGINVSPLVIKRGKTPGIVFENYRELIKDILTETSMNVALIPHVVWQHEDDREPLSKLYKEFAQTGRAVLLQDCGCMELKGYISGCRFFVGARTHAVIAAYSSGVPALAVGYSVKAGGIAADLLGTAQGYVIPAQLMETKKELSFAFKKLMQQEEQVKTMLRSKTENYPERLLAAADQVMR